MDPSIILQGRSPNVLANYAQGRQLGRQTAMQDMLRQNAGGLMQGDPQALNALAAYDPQLAQNMRFAGTQEARAAQAHDLAAKEANMRMQGLTQAQKIKAQEYAAGLSAAEKQAQLAKVEQGLKGAQFFYEKGDRAGYENFLRQSGIDPAQYPFEQFPAIANQYRDFAEILKTTEPKTQIVDGQLVTIGQDGATAAPIQGFQQPGPEWRAATPEEAAQYGAQAGQFNTKTGQFVKTPLDKGMRVVSDGNGGFTFEQGPGVTGTGDTSVGDVYNPGEVQDTLTLIDAISADPNLGRVLGPVQGGGGNDVEQLNAIQRAYYGSGGLNVIEKMNQLQSRTWLAARAMLKGGGPITDYESRKAEAAVARLSRTKDIKEYQAALKELRDAITEGMAKLEAAKRGKNVPQTGAGLPNFGNMTDDQLDAWISENSQ